MVFQFYDGAGHYPTKPFKITHSESGIIINKMILMCNVGKREYLKKILFDLYYLLG